MKLIELEPRWFTFAHPADGCSVYIGLTFLCPHCRQQRLGVRFEPAIGLPSGIAWPAGDGPFWHREGETFDTLTLTPSIDAAGNRIDFANHWHGFIRNGEIL